MFNILVIGSDGQLGHQIETIVKDSPQGNISYFFTTINDLDITKYAQIENKLNERKFDIVINCAAYTDVNKSEFEKELAFGVNGEAVTNIGRASKKHNCKVIHISTDYVFDGCSFLPYKEDDQVNPKSAYGQSKLKGEENLFNSNKDSIIIRTSWLYSSFGNNFVKTMIRLGNERNELKVVFDQIGTPTFAGDLANTIIEIVKQFTYSASSFIPGIYHYSNEGVCSWYDFTTSIFNLSGINRCKVIPIESIDFPTPAPRPHYSVLNKGKIKSTFGITIPHWEESLKICLKEILAYNN